MSQSGPEVEALYRALLSAFTDEGALARMLKFHMGLNLAEIGSGNLSNQVFAVITFVEARGLVDQLIQAALAANPGNSALLAIAARRAQAAQTEDAPSVVQAAPAIANVDKLALRKAMQASFAAEELELLCADIEQQLRARGHDVRLSLDDVAGATRPAKILNLIEFLDRRRLLNFLVDAVREQRPGSI